jgi:tetratricopeptide (TPR) repeat protein
LNEIDSLLKKNPFVEEKSSLILEIKSELKKAYKSSEYESVIRDVIRKEKDIIDSNLKEENKEVQTKSQNFQELLTQINKYSKAKKSFDKALQTISKYKIDCVTKETESMGHKLFINNNFKLDKDEFLSVLNRCLHASHQINSFKDIEPESLFKVNLKKRGPKLTDYDELETYINKCFEDMNKREYQIETEDGRDFKKLSAGWKTSVLLDLILGYEGDMAPIIIDQPEDNLATSYINEGLIRAIKKIKTKKQIILVSHNATIPMLGDAQNIVLCENKENKIIIKSGRLEDSISGKSTVDQIASITDGGKASIKKRVKKYNLKKFK